MSEEIVSAAANPHSPRCRGCGNVLSVTFVDLGMSPLCQKHVKPSDLARMEAFYPLQTWVCANCWLVQLEEYVTPSELFEHYEYFSSFSRSWVEHARAYVAMISDRLSLDSNSLAIEIASNDGYLLQHFVSRDIPCLGIEPAKNVADTARRNGIRCIVRFFGHQTAADVLEQYGPADLLIGNNVLAHVPDLHDFIAGLPVLLKADGVITLEFPHLARLIEHCQFDTIYHEHFSYFTLLVIRDLFSRHDLRIFDVDELPSHGGSIRIYACLSRSSLHADTGRVSSLIQQEIADGFTTMAPYAAFEERVKETKRKLLEFLIAAKRGGKSIAGYGAPGKGNTLLNYCGIRRDFIDFIVDTSPVKQGAYTPGTRIPILHPDAIRRYRPDFVLILPWNLRKEISETASYIRDWGGQFVVPIPEVEVVSA